MANEEHLARLLQGEAAWDWNEWRENNPHIMPDLRGASLTGRDLTLALLDRVDLAGADLTRADLCGTDLTGIDFTEAAICEIPLVIEMNAIDKSDDNRMSLEMNSQHVTRRHQHALGGNVHKIRVDRGRQAAYGMLSVQRTESNGQKALDVEIPTLYTGV